MRLNNEVSVFQTIVAADEYGGQEELTTSTENKRATISVKDNELKPLPSGLGFYRTITIIIDNDGGVGVGSIIQHNGIKFQLVREVEYSTNHFKCFVGHEV